VVARHLYWETTRVRATNHGPPKSENPGFGRQGLLLSLVSLVGAGRFDGRDSRGRLLMRDRDDFRDFRICYPAGWRRQAT
jgi:hypothetical protein